MKKIQQSVRYFQQQLKFYNNNRNMYGFARNEVMTWFVNLEVSFVGHL